ncbi:MAG: formyltransferase family protein [Bacteroidia bacterium]
MRIAVLCNDRLALPALQLLLQNRLIVAAGIPDRPSEATEIIRQRCESGGAAVQTFDRQDLDSKLEAWLHQHQPDVVLVKTFPWKIPARLLSIPKFGFINFHYAPLPEFRGPSPLFWMIRDQATELGVSIHRMEATYDTGDILLQRRVPLSPQMTSGMCTAQLAYMGAEMTGELLTGLLQASLKPVAQENSKAGWYKRPVLTDMRINWQEMNAESVHALVRACNPWAKGAPTSWKGWTFGISFTTITLYPVPEGTPAGTVLALDETNGLVVACKDGSCLRVDIIYTEEGFFPGYQLLIFGLKSGDQLAE